MSAPAREQHETDGPFLYAPPKVRRLQPAGLGRSKFTSAPPTAPELDSSRADMPLPRLSEGDAAIKDLRGRLSRDPDLTPQPPIRTQATSAAHWIGGWWFAAIMAAIALGTVLMVSPVGEAFRAGTPTSQARLFVTSQTGFVNEPLSLGVSLSDASGEETVTLAGLAAGTGLSAGTPLSLTRWRLSAHEIAGALAYSPKDFVGVMDVGIDLRSSGDRVMDSQVVRLEWRQRTEDRPRTPPEPSKPAASIEPSKPAAAIKSLDADAMAVLEHFLKNGDIMSARILLKRAAGNGNAQAALELGMTFDPTFLAERGVQGFAADVAEARAWYERAVTLGSSEASRNLERLTMMEK
jgi:hypothetical protein